MFPLLGATVRGWGNPGGLNVSGHSLAWGCTSVRKAASSYDLLNGPLALFQVPCRVFVRHYTLHVEFKDNDFHIYAVPKGFHPNFHSFVSLFHVSAHSLATAYACAFYFVHTCVSYIPVPAGLPIQYGLRSSVDLTEYRGRKDDNKLSSLASAHGAAVSRHVRKHVGAARSLARIVSVSQERFDSLARLVSGSDWCMLSEHSLCSHQCVGVEIAQFFMFAVMKQHARDSQPPGFFRCLACPSDGSQPVSPYVPLPLIAEHFFQHEFGYILPLSLFPDRCFHRLAKYRYVVGKRHFTFGDAGRI